MTIDFFGSRQAPFNLQDFPRSNNVSGLMSRDVDMRRGTPLFLLRGEDGNGGDKLDTGAVFAPAGGYPGFISADANPVTLCVSSEQDIEGFVIAFDSVVREYAKAMTLRFVGENSTLQERRIPNQNFLFGYRFEESVRSFSLEITEWSASHRPVRITAFSLNYHMDLTAREIISLEASREMVADNSEPSYGVVGQYGKLEILDSQGIMLDFARYGVLENNLPCKVTVKRNNGDEVFGEYLTGNWTTEFGTGTVSVELRDETDSWNDITAEIQTETNLPDNVPGIRRTDNLIGRLLGVAGVRSSQIVFDAPTSRIFQGFNLERTSITELLGKVAWLNQLAIYKRWDGSFAIERFAPKKTTNSDGTMTEYRADSPLYTIPPTKHTGTIKFSPVVDNRIDKVTGEAKRAANPNIPNDPSSLPFMFPKEKRDSRNPLQFEDNALFHESTTVEVGQIRIPSHIHLSNELLNEYARGKQTIEATLLPGDYMSMVEGKRECSQNYIPKAGDRHIYLDENLRPMSNYVNGYPKEFIVTSVVLEFSMDSGVSYKVTAQEIALY